MTGLREAPEPAMYTNGSPVSRRFVGGGASGVLNSCGIAAAVAPNARGRARKFEATLLRVQNPLLQESYTHTHSAHTQRLARRVSGIVFGVAHRTKVGASS